MDADNRLTRRQSAILINPSRLQSISWDYEILFINEAQSALRRKNQIVYLNAKYYPLSMLIYRRINV